MRKTSRAVLWIVVATGISSVVLQLISIRELLARFYGNEFVIALILFCWMSLGGTGTYFAKQASRRLFPPSVTRLIWLSLLLTVLPPLQVIAIREAYDWVFVHGSSVGFYPTFLYILLVLGPYGLLLGFALPYSLFVLRTLAPDTSGSRIYITDTIGDVTGGALFSFALVSLVAPLTAVCIAGLPLVAACILLMVRSGLAAVRFKAAAAFAALILMGGPFLETATLTQSEGTLIHHRESRYGRIAVLQQHEMRTLFLDGVPIFTNQNQQMAEEIVHYPLIQVPAPKRILVLSGEGGIMEEIEKYRPQAVDYVELDPAVTATELRFGLIKEIEGLGIIHQDGRAFLADTPNVYDAILLNVPEPDTFQLNRFYTDEFYRLVKLRLARDGVFSFSVQGFDNYLPEPQRQKLSVMVNTARRYFEQVLLLPGQRIFFLCGDRPFSLDIPGRLKIQNLSAPYISAYYDGDLSRRRIQDLNGLIDPSAPPNTDFRPRLMRIMFAQWFEKYATSPRVFIALVILLMLLYLAFSTRESYVLFTTGFINMGSELLVVFAFQIFFGYIYFQIGFIVTAFLAGLLPGAWLGERLPSKDRDWLIKMDLLLVLLPAGFVGGLFLLGVRLPAAFFMVFGFLVSLASGFQFPVALKLQGESKSAVTRSFSADLMGAACGTLVTSLLFIPYGGLVWTALALMGIKLSSLVLNRPWFAKETAS